MDYFIGSLVTVVFFVLVGGAYYLGTRKSKPHKPKAEPMSEEQKHVAAQLRNEYNEIMRYDVDKARGGTS